MSPLILPFKKIDKKKWCLASKISKIASLNFKISELSAPNANIEKKNVDLYLQT